MPFPGRCLRITQRAVAGGAPGAGRGTAAAGGTVPPGAAAAAGPPVRWAAHGRRPMTWKNQRKLFDLAGTFFWGVLPPAWRGNWGFIVLSRFFAVYAVSGLGWVSSSCLVQTRVQGHPRTNQQRGLGAAWLIRKFLETQDGPKTRS